MTQPCVGLCSVHCHSGTAGLSHCGGSSSDIGGSVDDEAIAWPAPPTSLAVAFARQGDRNEDAKLKAKKLLTDYYNNAIACIDAGQPVRCEFHYTHDVKDLFKLMPDSLATCKLCCTNVKVTPGDVTTNMYTHLNGKAHAMIWPWAADITRWKNHVGKGGIQKYATAVDVLRGAVSPAVATAAARDSTGLDAAEFRDKAFELILDRKLPLNFFGHHGTRTFLAFTAGIDVESAAKTFLRGTSARTMTRRLVADGEAFRRNLCERIATHAISRFSDSDMLCRVNIDFDGWTSNANVEFLVANVRFVDSSGNYNRSTAVVKPLGKMPVFGKDPDGVNAAREYARCVADAMNAVLPRGPSGKPIKSRSKKAHELSVGAASVRAALNEFLYSVLAIIKKNTGRDFTVADLLFSANNDTAAIVMAAFNDLASLRAPCFDHIEALCFTDLYIGPAVNKRHIPMSADFVNILSVPVEILNALARSSLHVRMFEAAYFRVFPSETTALRAIYDIFTRWLAKFNLVVRFLALHKVLIKEMSHQDYGFTAEKWTALVTRIPSLHSILVQLVILMAPFAVWCLFFQSVSPTLGFVHEAVREMLATTDPTKFAHPTTCPEIRNIAETLRKRVVDRFQGYIVDARAVQERGWHGDLAASIALLADPRTLALFHSSHGSEITILWIFGAENRRNGLVHQLFKFLPTAPTNKVAAPVPIGGATAWDLLNARPEFAVQTAAVDMRQALESKLVKEVTEYVQAVLRHKTIATSCDTNPLLLMTDAAYVSSYPLWSTIQRGALGGSGSSAGSEQIASLLGQLISKTRNRLGSTTAEYLTLLTADKAEQAREKTMANIEEIRRKVYVRVFTALQMSTGICRIEALKQIGDIANDRKVAESEALAMRIVLGNLASETLAAMGGPSETVPKVAPRREESIETMHAVVPTLIVASPSNGVGSAGELLAAGIATNGADSGVCDDADDDDESDDEQSVDSQDEEAEFQHAALQAGLLLVPENPGTSLRVAGAALSVICMDDSVRIEACSNFDEDDDNDENTGKEGDDSKEAEGLPGGLVQMENVPVQTRKLAVERLQRVLVEGKPMRRSMRQAEKRMRDGGQGTNPSTKKGRKA